MADPVLVGKAAATVLTDEKTRKAVGWALVAVLSPIVLLVAFFCSLGSGTSNHNVSVTELCFQNGAIPADTPQEYRACIEEMRASFSQLDTSINAINSQAEEGTSLDGIRVKAIFYALYFGAESQGDVQSFADCFVTYEERTRIVTTMGEDGSDVETEETYAAAVPTGTSVRAALPGTVTVAQYNSSYGYYVMIDHGNGLSTLYAHNSKLLVQVGQTVETGDVISLSGSTGRSTGPHLHFEVRINGERTNPRSYLP